MRFFLHLRTDTQIRTPVSAIAIQDIRPAAILSVEIVLDVGLGVELRGDIASVGSVNHIEALEIFMFNIIHIPTDTLDLAKQPLQGTFKCTFEMY